MKKTSIISFILCFCMLVSLLPTGFVMAQTDDNAGKGERRVYLHAFSEAPELETSENRGTVYMGEDTNVFLAVDSPNKGTYLDADHENVLDAEEAARIKATNEAEKNPNLTTDEAKQKYIDYEVSKAVQLARHSQPQYDMQGYTVKIYFDTKYFKFADDANPIDFKEPNKTNGFEIVDGEEIKVDTSLNPGYMTHKPSYKCDDSDREGYAAATVFLMGNGFFPNGTGDKWYNLCRLPLIPLQPGHTSVRLEYSMGTDDDLELFAKNVDDERLNFDAEVLNDGVFYLTIEEAGRPQRPLATRPGGTYNDEIEVKLYHTNNDPCEIWYSTNGEDPRNNEREGVRKYALDEQDINKSEALPFSTNTVLKARTYRPSDGMWSDLATFTYEFLPRAPYLFNSEEKEIPNIYSETWKDNNTGYYVFTADSRDFSNGISAGNSIYYTFDESLSPQYILREENSFVGDNPETQWTLVNGVSQRLDTIINQSRTVRLVTANKWGISEVSVYHLSIKPATVTATPDSGLDREQPVTLECETDGAKIYYTTNGDDPRKETRIEYTSPIYLEEDTVIKAVSLYDGQWSEVSSFWYIFTGEGKSGVSAVYPSGIYIGSVEVILYPDEPGGEIEVSFDGGKTWEPYDGTITGDTTTVDSHIEFNARIKNPENTDEDLGDKFVYIIKPLAPVFSPEGCDFTSADVVTVFSPESTNDNKHRFELWYSLDGTEPDGSLKAPENDVVNIPVTGYTKIKAVVVKDGEYKSETIEQVYNVVYDKPAKPTATLPSGYYTREIGSEEFTVSFNETPKGVTIYYTIGDRDTPFDAPDLTIEGGATEYVPGSQIPVENGTMIKAIAVQTVNGNIIKSDVAIFDYIITPEAPVAPKSSAVQELPLIPVDALAVEKGDGERCIVIYKIGNETDGYVTGSIPCDEVGTDGKIRFYIDTKTGNAYADAEGKELLYDGGRQDEFSNGVILEIKTVLDDAESETNAYAYIIDSEALLKAPFADKESGTYDESKTPFVVNFYSVYGNRSDITIEWKYDTDADWSAYDPLNPPEFETKDKIIYARTTDGKGNVSPSAGYIYTFNPPAPDITPKSGMYKKADEKSAVISHADDIAYEERYYSTYYKVSTDDIWYDTRNPAPISPYKIEKTMTVMAYTYNRLTGRVSDTVHRSYVVVSDSALGAITIKWPYSQSRISAHKLGKGEYADGIQFIPETDVYYEYVYTLTDEAGGGTYKSQTLMYDEKAAFVPTERIDCITVTAWINGDKNNTLISHMIDFIHLSVPVTDLPERSEYDKGTTYHVINEYKDDPTVIVYYTTNNTDPTIDSADRKSFTLSDKSSEETLSATTTVKTVYYSACGEGDCPSCSTGDYKNCPDHVYGEVGEYKYPVPTVTTVHTGGGGGGGGGYVVDKTRLYTKDIFGVEHPTHIGYINGYPDGTVRPEGDITRDEMVAILYRIMNHEYEAPFTVTADVFPDVTLDLWAVKEIEYMADKNVVTGYPDGEFKPRRNLTRGEFAALIFRFTGVKKADIDNPYTDLEEDYWAYEEILALNKAGIMLGNDNKEFGADNNITRAEVMATVNRILGRKPLESYVKSLEYMPYHDLFKNKWYYVDVQEATITHDYYLDKNGYEYKWENMK